MPAQRRLALLFALAFSSIAAAAVEAQDHSHHPPSDTARAGRSQPAKAQPVTAQPAKARPAPLSPRDSVRLPVGIGEHVKVVYSRPSARGRKIMGGLVPFGKVWRTGANAATTLTTPVDLRIGNATIPPGMYTLYTIPTAGDWTLIVNRQTGQWGTQYDAKQDLVRIPLRRSTVARPVEQFTIAMEPGTAGNNTLALTWENTRVAVPFRVLQPAHR